MKRTRTIEPQLCELCGRTKMPNRAVEEETTCFEACVSLSSTDVR